MCVSLLSVQDALIDQLRNNEVMARIHRATEQYLGVERGALVARELVADAVGDTFQGRLTWRVERVPFETHVMDEVRQRARRLRSRKAYVSLAELPEPDLQAVEVSDSEPVGKAWYPPVEELAELICRVRTLAIGDAPVLHLLQLYELGVTRMRDVVWAGMPRGTYAYAKKRLKRYAGTALRARTDSERNTLARGARTDATFAA